MQSIRIAVLALALCFGASLLPVQSHAAAPLPKVKIETSMGDIVVELNPAKAPKTVSNFLYYVKSGFYNNTIFHRVINRMDMHLEQISCHPMEIRRYYHRLDY